MNKIEIEEYNKKLSELGEFAKGKDEFKENEIIDWVSDCVNLFSEIGVNKIIIDDFLNFFSFSNEKIEIKDPYNVHCSGIRLPGSVTDNRDYIKVKIFGPFQEVVDFRREKVFHSLYSLRGSFYYAKIAFSSARNVLKKAIDNKRLVSWWLIDVLSVDEKSAHIISSLESIENKYQEKDSNGLISASNTLLDSVLNLDENLNKKRKMGDKFRSLIDNDTEREKFGVSKDLVLTLNSSRLIRNEKIIHKDIPLKYNVPFIVATSFAYLTLFFVEVVILNGEIYNVPVY